MFHLVFQMQSAPFPRAPLPRAHKDSCHFCHVVHSFLFACCSYVFDALVTILGYKINCNKVQHIEIHNITVSDFLFPYIDRLL